MRGKARVSGHARAALPRDGATAARLRGRAFSRAYRLTVLYNVPMQQDHGETRPDTHVEEAEREDVREMAASVEALLFASAEPLEMADLRRILGIRQPLLERVLQHLGRMLTEGKRGLRLQRQGGLARLVTAPETAIHVEKLRGQQGTQRLSDAALETLALIAYNQPATRPQIEAVRGVDCSGVVSTLLSRGLVEEVGRLETPGHPVLYGTTLAFLQHFGLESPAQLPPVGEDAGDRANQATMPPR